MVAAQTRKRKRTSTAKVATPKPAPTAKQPVQYDEAAESAKMERLAAVWQAFDKLRAKANEGDRQARLTLVRFCNANPHLWAMLGDTAKLAETSIIDTIVRGEWLSGRAIAREADQLRKRLSRPLQSPLEEVAVRRLVACKMQADFVDSQCSRVDGTVDQAKFWLQRQAQAHRLYAAAEKSLLLIRGLIPADESHNTTQGNDRLSEQDEKNHENVPAIADRVHRINHVINGNGYAAANGKYQANRLNGNRVAGILETIGAAAEG